MIERMASKSRLALDKIGRQLASRQRGQALAEFALVVPVLSIILFGLTELGLMLNDQVTITNASRNGARVAAINAGSQSAVNTAVTDATSGSSSLIDCPVATPTVSAYSGQTTDDGWTVTVSCTYTPITPLSPLFRLVGGGASSTYTISASTTMKSSTCLPPCY
jgi:Flp pilus assembly protein TadG